jgi:hypothetical protein
MLKYNITDGTFNQFKIWLAGPPADEQATD